VVPRRGGGPHPRRVRGESQVIHAPATGHGHTAREEAQEVARDVVRGRGYPVSDDRRRKAGALDSRRARGQPVRVMALVRDVVGDHEHQASTRPCPLGPPERACKAPDGP